MGGKDMNLLKNLRSGVFGLTFGAVLMCGVTVPDLAAAQDILRYWTFIDPKQGDIRAKHLADEIARFEQANSGIKVEVDVLPWHQITPQMIQGAAAGRTPDVARVLGWDLPELVAAGALTRLNDHAANWPENVRDDFIIAAEGDRMAVPLEYRTPVMWYRADLLEKAGVAVPQTLDDLAAAGKALSQIPNTQGFVIGLSRAGGAVALSEPFMSLLWAAGGELVDAEGKPTFNGDAGVKVLTAIKKLVDDGAMSNATLGYTYEEVFSGVKAGTVAMAFLGSQRVASARAAGEFGDRLKTAPLPGFEAGKPAPAHAFGWNLVIGKDSKNADAAWKFIDHMTSAEAQVRQAMATGELPTRKSPYEDTFFQTSESDEIKSWVSYIEGGRTPNYPRGYTEMAQLIADAVQEVVARNADPKQALDNAAQRYSSLRR
jgi:multiple sugar transport system substrate-binding protein